MCEIALGTTVFKRTNKLGRLLNSVPEFVDTVYVSDDGRTENRSHIYNKNYNFDLNVIDLKYDSGLGKGRFEIVNRATEDYIYIVDSDHEVPKNADILIEQLEDRNELGGVSGIFAEGDSLICGSHDLFVSKSYLIRDIRSTKSPIESAGQSLYKFDFIPNVALFRSECLQDYHWDPEYVIGMEHLDFYLGHSRRTKWEFATNPRVIFPHDRGGSQNYMSNRTNSGKLQSSRRYFLNKWDLEGIVNIQSRWLHTYDPGRESTRAFRPLLNTILRKLPPSLGTQLISFINSYTKYHL
jgi:glycosyltransferase involved in cell wall biosynthesis